MIRTTKKKWLGVHPRMVIIKKKEIEEMGRRRTTRERKRTREEK